MSLNNTWVVITGASRGLGVTIAEEFAKRRANLILIARSAEGLKKTCDQVKNFAGQVHTIAFDLGEISEIENLVGQINKMAPRIDILVNNAGLEKYCFFTRYQREDIVSVINVNLVAPMELTRLLLPGMLNRKKGHIINISSVAGKLGEIYNALYDTSKGGMELWTDALRQELYKTGVKVSSINPGGVSDTGMIYNIGVKYPALLGACTAQGVADAVIKCTSKYKSRVFINSMPIKPFIIISVLFPRIADAIFRLLRVTKTNRKKVEVRMRSDQQKAAKESKTN